MNPGFVGGGCDDSNMCLAEQSPRDAALAQLAGLDPAMLDTAVLMGQITDLATFISQARGHLARLAGALDACGGAADAAGASAGGLLHARPGRWRRPGHPRYDALSGPDRLCRP